MCSGYVFGVDLLIMQAQQKINVALCPNDNWRQATHAPLWRGPHAYTPHNKLYRNVWISRNVLLKLYISWLYTACPVHDLRLRPLNMYCARNRTKLRACRSLCKETRVSPWCVTHVPSSTVHVVSRTNQTRIIEWRPNPDQHRTCRRQPH